MGEPRGHSEGGGKGENIRPSLSQALAQLWEPGIHSNEVLPCLLIRAKTILKAEEKKCNNNYSSEGKGLRNDSVLKTLFFQELPFQEDKKSKNIHRRDMLSLTFQ